MNKYLLYLLCTIWISMPQLSHYKNLPQLGVTSLHRSSGSAASMRGKLFMKKTPIWRNTSLENLLNEEWRPIDGYEGFYEISNYCRVKSLKRIDCRGQKRPTKILLQSFDNDGYCQVVLCKDRDNKTTKPHRVGALIFVPNPNNLPEVNHLDGVKTNNWVGNFEWSTTKDNLIHAEAIGSRRSICGEKNYGALLTSEQVLEIYKSPLSNKELSVAYDISPLAINRIKIGKTWRSVTGAKYKQKRPSNIYLPDELVLSIFNDNSGGRHLLADKYSQPFYVISHIKNGVTYSNVTGKKYVRKYKK